MNNNISTPTIKSIYIVKEIWWYIKEYVFGNEYWKRRFAPSLKSITEWAGEICHSAYLDMKVGNFTPGSRRWSEILTRVNCRNIYRQCHLKEVEKEARPKDLPRGMEVNEYQYSIYPLVEWDRMFIGGGFIQGAEMGDTYGVRRNDAPEWVKDGPNPRCIHFSQGYLVHHRLIFDIEKLGGLIVPEDSERLWLSPGFNIYNLNTATYTKFSQQPWNESAHRHYFNDLDHAEWECDF